MGIEFIYFVVCQNHKIIVLFFRCFVVLTISKWCEYQCEFQLCHTRNRPIQEWAKCVRNERLIKVFTMRSNFDMHNLLMINLTCGINKKKFTKLVRFHEKWVSVFVRIKRYFISVHYFLKQKTHWTNLMVVYTHILMLPFDCINMIRVWLWSALLLLTLILFDPFDEAKLI